MNIEKSRITFNSLNAVLVGRCAQKKKLANNTWVIRLEDGNIAIRLHQTNILIYQKNGLVAIHAGGWLTATTKARLNEFLPEGYHINQRKRHWYIHTPDGEVDFQEGFLFNTNAPIASEDPLSVTDDIIAFELGELSQDQVVGLFQKLINTGLAWQLQGSYGRTARYFIEAGLCNAA